MIQQKSDYPEFDRAREIGTVTKQGVTMALNWLPLTEYSSKYQVSISTLRRRIKADEIKYQLRDGRYLIFDEPRAHRPSQAAHVVPSLSEKAAVEFQPAVKTFSNINMNMGEKVEMKSEAKSDEPILTAANRLLSELKKAYTQILQEKEEQILSLKSEVSDLKTLVRVLESENQRLSHRK